jgi:hypothetical protein
MLLWKYKVVQYMAVKKTSTRPRYRGRSFVTREPIIKKVPAMFIWRIKREGGGGGV